MTRTIRLITSHSSLDLRQFAGCKWVSLLIGICLPHLTLRESARPSLRLTPYLYFRNLNGLTKLWLFVTPSLDRPKFLIHRVSTPRSQNSSAPIAPISDTST